MNTRIHAPLLCVGLLAALAVVTPADAFADEVDVLDLQTCEVKTLQVAEVVAETWTNVTVRMKRKGSGPTEDIPTISVIAVRREDGREGEAIDAAEREILRGNFKEAARLMKQVAGGGYQVNAESGERVFNSFDAGDPKGRNERPTWQREYSHFLYAKALFLQGQAEEEKRILEEALLALDDVPVPGGKDKQTSGGFLGRFENGNSRFYPEAMKLKAHTLTALGKFAEAEKAFAELNDAALENALHPKWAYEAAIGPGLIKEAQGDDAGAIDAYNAAAGKVLALVKRELRGCLRLELGRLFSRAQVMGTAVKLRQAEKSPNKAALLGKLRTELEGMTPENLGRKYRTLPKDAQDALIQGARDPLVRAVSNNGIGLAYLIDERFEDAVLALRKVAVIYFEIEEHALRANHYLAEAAAGAAKKSEGAARKMYEAMAEEAQAALKGSEWENK